MRYNITPHTDEERIDFLIENDVQIDANSYFTCLTQHVDRGKKNNSVNHVVKDLREFCDYGIELDLLLKANNLNRHSLYWMYSTHTQLYFDAWFNEHRPLNENELQRIKSEDEKFSLLVKNVLREIKE